MARVGVDLDGVIYDFEGALRQWLHTTRGYDLKRMPTATQWELANDWGMTRAEFVEACEEAVEAGFLFHWGAPINDAQHQLWRLKIAGHSVHLLTARDFGTRSQENTVKWVHEYGLPHDSLDFTHDKASVPTDYMIDDKPGNYLDLIASGTVAALQDRPYNADFNAGYRVGSLEQFVDFVIAYDNMQEAA